MLNWTNVVKAATHDNPTPDRRVEKSDAEWKAQLTEEQYRVTRAKGTEARFSGEHCTSYDPGIYSCICCDTDLFDSSDKYDSRSGWPSFSEPVKDNAIRYVKDGSLGMVRIETVCNTCDAHLGHVFPDGPKPSGLRFCINSISLIKKTENDQ